MNASQYPHRLRKLWFLRHVGPCRGVFLHGRLRLDGNTQSASRQYFKSLLFDDDDESHVGDTTGWPVACSAHAGIMTVPPVETVTKLVYKWKCEADVQCVCHLSETSPVPPE